MSEISDLLKRSKQLRIFLERHRTAVERSLSSRVIQTVVSKNATFDTRSIKVHNVELSEYEKKISSIVFSYVEKSDVNFSIGDICLWIVSQGFKLESTLEKFTEIVINELTKIESSGKLSTEEDENRGLLYRRRP